MPNPRAFLQSFKLHKNSIFGEGCVLARIGIKHVVVEEYRRYTFPLTVDVLTTLKSAHEVLEHFRLYVSGHKVVNSQYGNPYDCYIGDFSIKLMGTQTLLKQRREDSSPKVKMYTITCVGYGNRILIPSSSSATLKNLADHHKTPQQ